MNASLDPVPEGAISVTNVRPAFETSLQFGATEAELSEGCGLTRALVLDDGATVPGSATYAHMELMYAKPAYAQFVVAAAGLHTMRSLGVVGLACKTVATLGDAMACHYRFQHLTNRTARYQVRVDAKGEGEPALLVLEEERFGPPRLGSLLISDYTMLIAATLLAQGAVGAPRPQVLRSRRDSLDEAERSAYEAFLGAPVELGAEHAALVYDASVVMLPVSSADPELAEYFAGLLSASDSLGEESEPTIVSDTRLAIRDGLVTGTLTMASVARGMGLGARTLQRRLADEGMTFAEMRESTRRRLARRYLGDAALSLAEIAYLLGYREQASFFRAFRGWYGCTPTEFRRSAKMRA